MPGEDRIPRWPLRLTLSFLMVFEILFLIKLVGEGVAGNISLLASSVGIVVFCVLAWRGIAWSRWLVVALLVWRLVEIGMDMATHFAPGDHRIAGTLILIVLYAAAGAVIASPLGRPIARSAN